MTGWVVSLVVCPVDQLKVAQQTAFQQGARGRVAALDLAKGLARAHGGLIRGLYRCMGPCIAEMSVLGVYFTVYNAMSRGLAGAGGGDPTGKLTSFAAGGVAGVSMTISAAPFDFVKSRLMTRHAWEAEEIMGKTRGGAAAKPGGGVRGAGPTSFTGCFRHVLRTEGPGVFYRGLTPALMRAFPAGGATFVTTELVVRNWPF